MNPGPRLPVAVLNFIIDRQGRFLFVSRDGRRWRTMGGQLEEGETVTQCVAREIGEELGEIRCRLLDVIDAHVFEYPNLGPILSIFTLVQYEAGTIVPASDIKGWEHDWFVGDQLDQLDIEVPIQRELVEKARYMASHYSELGELGFHKSNWKQPT
jgi:NADH pyrophosphatase NudC (nudix superfamily)